MATQVADSQFADTPLGCHFELRVPLAKATAKKCRECGASVFAHSRAEVDDKTLLLILNATADTSATLVGPGLMVGSFQAAIAEAAKSNDVAVLNCAGTALHDFFPKSRPPMDALRREGRLLDLEWIDADDFEFDVAEVCSAVAWVKDRVVSGGSVVVNCAQGKSRSGTMACAYLMASTGLTADEALAKIQAARPLVQPNVGFMRQLRKLDGKL
mmetsp:Transcript_26864/g.70561  ORF Transcript_26864/g.70561 Transcript_26864/m.70561 type:complete len:214 (+) Transcript_26864:114-755(+)